MKSLLTVVFLINGHWVQMDGWHELEIDSRNCDKYVQSLSAQLESMDAPVWEITCNELLTTQKSAAI